MECGRCKVGVVGGVVLGALVVALCELLLSSVVWLEGVEQVRQAERVWELWWNCANAPVCGERSGRVGWLE